MSIKKSIIFKCLLYFFTTTALISYCILPFIKNAPKIVPKNQFFENLKIDFHYTWWQFLLFSIIAVIPILYTIMSWVLTKKLTKRLFYITLLLGITAVVFFCKISIDNYIYYRQHKSLSIGQRIWNVFAPRFQNTATTLENTDIAFFICTALFTIQFVFLAIFGFNQQLHKKPQ